MTTDDSLAEVASLSSIRASIGQAFAYRKLQLPHFNEGMPPLRRPSALPSIGIGQPTRATLRHFVTCHVNDPASGEFELISGNQVRAPTRLHGLAPKARCGGDHKLTS